MFVSPARFTTAHALSFWSNAGQKNNIGIELTLSQSLPINGNIVVAFPLTLGTITLFQQDLGYGKNSNS